MRLSGGICRLFLRIYSNISLDLLYLYKFNFFKRKASILVLLLAKPEGNPQSKIIQAAGVVRETLSTNTAAVPYILVLLLVAFPTILLSSIYASISAGTWSYVRSK